MRHGNWVGRSTRWGVKEPRERQEEVQSAPTRAEESVVASGREARLKRGTDHVCIHRSTEQWLDAHRPAYQLEIVALCALLALTLAGCGKKKTHAQLANESLQAVKS